MCKMVLLSDAKVEVSLSAFSNCLHLCDLRSCFNVFKELFKISALAGVAQGIECQPAN